MDVEFERRLLRPTNGPRSLLASPGSPQRPPGATAAALAAAHSHRSPISVKLQYYKGYFRICLTLIDFFVFQSPARRSLFREPGCSLSPLASPAKRERFGDRFIPTRSGNNWETNFSMISVSYKIIRRIIAIESISNYFLAHKKICPKHQSLLYTFFKKIKM